MPEYIWQMLAGVIAQIQLIEQSVAGMVQSLAYDMANGLANLATMVGGSLSGLATNIGGVITQVAVGVVQSMGELLSPIMSTLQGIVETVREFFGGLIGDLKQAVLDLWSTVTTYLRDGLSLLRDFVSDLWSEIRGFLRAGIDQVGAWISEARNWVVALVTRGLEEIESATSKIVGDAAKGLAVILVGAQKIVADTERLVQEAWQRVVTGADSLLEEISGRLTDVKEGMKDLAVDVVEQVSKSGEDFTAGMKTLFKESLESIMAALTPQGYEEIAASFERITSPNTLRLLTRDDAYAFMQSCLPSSETGKTFFKFLITYSLALRVFTGIADANADIIAQKYSLDYPWRNMFYSQVTQAFWTGELDREGALLRLQKSGFDATDAASVLDSSRTYPPPEVLLEMGNRGAITPDEVTEGLTAQGYTARWRGAYKWLAKVIPPPADLIHMAVREAFSPEIAEAYGQYEDFPESIVEHCAARGLSSDWAKRYWAAHWSLPSPQQGFEMLHRGATMRDGHTFGLADMDVLLRALDVMPAWRTPLTQIAYRTYTRVDIRRMHKAGVLGDEDLLKAYKDIGYDETHAAHLRDFTLKLNAPQKPESADELGRLTRGTVITFYRSGLMPRERAQALLVELGITASAASLYLDAADLAETQEHRAAEYELLYERALSGEITRQALSDELSAKGATDVEISNILLKLTRAESRKIKLPSHSEGEQMYTLGIIREEDFRALLSRMGYSAVWVEAFVRLAQAKAQKRQV